MVIRQWPVNGLEHVSNCPVCSSDRRELLHQGLKDRVFFCAPGEWTMYRCKECGSAYLDPRPNPETIGLAYSNYFTHNFNSREDLSNLSLGYRIRRILANGYLNHRFGTNYYPDSSLGILAAILFPKKRAVLDRTGRNLPENTRGKLLDIGCGDGSFLELAKRSGWEVVGVDPDQEAVKVGLKGGLDVRHGDVSILDPSKEQFDGITMSHVIEHVHDPRSILHSCYQLLKHGGWLWIETPNLGAQGHTRYGANYLHLDPPRHLVLFIRNSLQYILEKAGFQRIEDQPYRPLCRDAFAASEAIAAEQDPKESRKLSLGSSLAVYVAELKAKKDVSVREFITVKAWKTKI